MLYTLKYAHNEEQQQKNNKIAFYEKVGALPVFSHQVVCFCGVVCHSPAEYHKADEGALGFQAAKSQTPNITEG